MHDNENPSTIFNEIKIVEPLIEHLYESNVWDDNIHSTYNTCKNIIVEYEMTILHNYLKDHIGIFANELKLDCEFILNDSWFNKMYKHGFQGKHVHEHDTISGCYYFDNSGEFEQGICFHIENHFGKEDCVKFPFAPNRLIMFQGLTQHSVLYKKTDGVRKSISFNFIIPTN